MNLEMILSEANSIGISGHVRPDGDCVGSTLALYNYIRTYHPEKEVAVYLEEPHEKFLFLGGAKELNYVAHDEKIYDAFFILDCGDSNRIGFASEMYERANKQYCVDHHISNQTSGDHVYVVPSASSTCELVYNLISLERITKEIGECLYLGIAHDTGVFQYSNVAPSTMRAAANLLELGIAASKIVEDTYFEKTYLQNYMVGKAFTDSQLVLDGKCLTYCLSYEEMQEIGVVPSDLDSIVSQLRNTQGVDVAVFLYALNEKAYKVSMRSNDNVDVSSIATGFGGGGHKKAAGFDLEASGLEILELVVAQIAAQIKK